MSFLYAMRYFQVVAVVPRMFVAGFVIAVAAAAFRLTNDPSAAVDALTPVLLLQLFAASSGFRLPARRGYYDLLLTSGVPRWQIALAHGVASVTPGLVAWMCVALLEVAASHGASVRSVSIGSSVAFGGLSLVAWASAIGVSRAMAALSWLLILTIPPVARIASPVQLLGVSPEHPAVVVTCTCAAVGVAVAVACASIARMAVPLEGSQ